MFIKHGSRKSRTIRNHKDIKTNDNQGELALDTSVKYISSSKQINDALVNAKSHEHKTLKV